ncbi:TonB-dependent receptor [Flavobacteriaceae bacterium F89]|uniref:TonB-dependent receptor n=1 Tax=Cerina litoralis TaxID=2874477 RepID=A0AAE3JUF6_9FLAO|nr:TonB-dependent receptor [Cerina litoralis]MCG2462347.1 TonB-dependent receptor [Cerina litoralis]
MKLKENATSAPCAWGWPGCSYRVFAVLFCSLVTEVIQAQVQKVILNQDTILPINLEEVILISSFKKAMDSTYVYNPMATLDNYLESSTKMEMLKRGAYAWEPVLNDMSSERLSITIDGMHIFGACTDKMDPVTAYVDVSNLSEARISSGQQGSEQGSTIGGAIDLKLEKSNFKPTGWIGEVRTGGEFNNAARMLGGKVDYSAEHFYVDTDVIYRRADDYNAGGGEEVPFSQYEKYNLSANVGFMVSDGKKLSTSFIYDEARDVGYPALTMDVSLARAFIGSVTWLQDRFVGNFMNWETKLYANTIEHVMDDTKRPDVPMHMDMPGWSDTYGYYSQTGLKVENHKFLVKWDGFYNKSLAEMTMYPKDFDEKTMFMLTWPDVRTLNTGFYAEDKIGIQESSLKLLARLGIQNNTVASDFGLNSLRIFYPDMVKSQGHFLKSFSAQYQTKIGFLDFNGGLAYGDRAPSVTEGYGFYLFNSFDNYDYIGNPNLKNEKSIEGNLRFSSDWEKLKLGLEGHYFHIKDYILGEIDTSLSAMTLGAEGVKIYGNLDYATLYNATLDAEYAYSTRLKLSGNISYHRGIDQDGGNLPFISPLAYRVYLQYDLGFFTGSFAMKGAGRQVNFNPGFGEDETDAYTVFSLNLGKRFILYDNMIDVAFGVDNVFDTYYSTYSDWKDIPRMGRNFFMSVSYAIK